MNKKLLFASFAVSLLIAAKPVYGETPNFTSCLTPTGTVIADYNDGTHGIVGMGSKIGKDKVYSIEGGAMQCFCGNDGSGIQTNWKKIGNLTEDEIKIQQSQGWIYVPSGAAWGLSDEPYLAKNINYSCGSSTTNNGGGSSSSSSTVQASHGTQQLASTGNLLFISEVFGLGVILTLLGIFIRLRTNTK